MTPADRAPPAYEKFNKEDSRRISRVEYLG
jgi:hypothetical protein